MTNSTIDGARVAGVAIGGHDIVLDDVAVNDARTGVRVERGAGNVAATRLKLSGGQDGLVTTAGTDGRGRHRPASPMGWRTTRSATSRPA